jgi:hypothetical protein
MEGQEKDVEKQSCSQKNSTTNNSKNNAQKEKPNVSSGVQLQPTAQQQQQPFKKGRRRARSMPPSHHVEKQATTARDSASRQQQNSHKVFNNGMRNYMISLSLPLLFRLNFPATKEECTAMLLQRQLQMQDQENRRILMPLRSWKGKEILRSYFEK